MESYTDKNVLNRSAADPYGMASSCNAEECDVHTSAYIPIGVPTADIAILCLTFENYVYLRALCIGLIYWPILYYFIKVFEIHKPHKMRCNCQVQTIYLFDRVPQDQKG